MMMPIEMIGAVLVRPFIGADGVSGYSPECGRPGQPWLRIVPKHARTLGITVFFC